MWQANYSLFRAAHQVTLALSLTVRPSRNRELLQHHSQLNRSGAPLLLSIDCQYKLHIVAKSSLRQPGSCA